MDLRVEGRSALPEDERGTPALATDEARDTWSEPLAAAEALVEPVAAEALDAEALEEPAEADCEAAFAVAAVESDALATDLTLPD